METIQIFQGIQGGELNEMLHCFAANAKRFRPGATVLEYTLGLHNICVLLSGSAEVRSVDVEGNEFIVETLEQNAVFGELFTLPMESVSLLAVAKTPCEVLFIRYERAVCPCERLCAHHERLIHNLLMLSARKSQALSRRITILSQKSLRQKLLMYFEYCANETKQDTFELPVTLVELAAYIAADRSAMMREIGKMRAEGLIQSSGRNFTLTRSKS